MAQETNLASIHEDAPGLAQWVKDPTLLGAYGVGRGSGSNLALLWLWFKPATTAPIRSLA